jgi:malonyl-CoA/methylmalonyl-CoA synthetase
MSFWKRLVARWPDTGRTAVETSSSSLTYGDLERRALRAAGALASLGVGRGDVVGLQAPRDAALLELHLGALALGAVALPLNDAYTVDELAYLLGDARARVAVLVTALPAPVDGLRVVEAADVRALLDGATEAGAADVADDEPAILLYTSGTTGRPKGALLSHRNVRATVEALHAAWEWSDRDVLLHALPLFHVHGLIVAQYGALWAAARTIWLERFDARTALWTLEASGATVFMGVPTFYTRFLDLPADVAADLAGVRLFTSGSAPLPAAVHRAFTARFGHEIVERYGMTEVGIVLSNPIRGPRKPGSVGVAVPGAEVRVADPDTGEPVPPGQEGEVQVRGPSVFLGYLGRPDQTAAALAGDWMRTGDLGRTDEDGYVTLLGRRSELVLSGGLNVYPAEVERVLAAAPGVAEVAVFGLPDADLGERVAAAIVAADPRDPPDTEALRSACRAQLAAYKVPKRIYVVDALPRNAMGKVVRAALAGLLSAPTVRDATPADLDRLVAWNVEMARETEALALDPDTVRRGVSAVLRHEEPGFYLIVEVAGEVAGQCLITMEWSDWRARTVFWLQSVYVPPAWRGRGVYRSLYEGVKARARRAGAAGIRLYVDTTNERAMDVYARCGMDGGHYRVFEEMFDTGTEG